MTICERFDVVAVPFPFSDIPRVKRRKALVLCVARMKLFTLDNRLILSRTGSLSAADRRSVVAAFREALPQHA